MSVLIPGHSIEENRQLLDDLLDHFGAIAEGNVCGFATTSVKWQCKSCFRTKRQIARIDKNRNLWCAIVRHHDHYRDLAFELFHKYGLLKTRMASVVLESFERFPETLICEDCNNADTVAKRKAGAPKDFSFAPHEIAYFIQVRPNQPHDIDAARATAAWEAISPSMKLLKSRLIETIKGARGEGFEAVGDAAARVLMHVAIQTLEDV